MGTGPNGQQMANSASGGSVCSDFRLCPCKYFSFPLISRVYNMQKNVLVLK